jgi:hypothetical protein
VQAHLFIHVTIKLLAAKKHRHASSKFTQPSHNLFSTTILLPCFYVGAALRHPVLHFDFTSRMRAG